MRLKSTTDNMPDWFYKCVGEEWGDEYRSIQEQGRLKDEFVDYVIEFYKRKGITAWHEGYSIWLEIDLNTPEWIMRLLKYSGEKL